MSSNTIGNNDSTTIEETNGDNTAATVTFPPLGSWSSLTTLLLRRGGWNVVDEPFGDRFGNHLRRELDDSHVWDTLQPARTHGDVRANEIWKILSRNHISADTIRGNPTKAAALMLQNSSSKTTATTVERTPSTTSTTTTTSRGDHSAFLSRSMRDKSNFNKRFPYLAHYITTMETRVESELPNICFDFSLTSVQLAEYPGDGQANYPRHCDREAAVCFDQQHQQQSKSQISTASNITTNTTNERIITILYYLTPDDWDAVTDGGCLRIFHHQNDTNTSHTDVVPYANRMVIFRSDYVEHEVRPSRRRPRRAMSMWLYGKEVTTTLKTDEAASPVNKNTIDATNTGSQMQQFIDIVPSGPPPLSIISNQIDEGSNQPTIFVSIASFRDSETGPTLRDMMAKALFPCRVFVGLVLQVDYEKDRETVLNKLPRHESWYHTNVRTIQMDAHLATGPCPARAHAQLLHRNEDYVLQIDSHMRFRKNWDVYLIQELEACTTQPALLTTYPVGYTLPDEIPNETRGTILYPWKFDVDGMLRQKARLLESQPDRPLLCSLFAAGFCFGPSAWIECCPYDAHLHHLFFGEELSMAIRLYTHGYDCYAPREAVCYHLWSRSHRPPGNPISTDAREKSINAIKKQIEGEGLGSVRSLDDWASVVGVDIEHMKIAVDTPNESTSGSIADDN